MSSVMCQAVGEEGKYHVSGVRCDAHHFALGSASHLRSSNFYGYFLISGKNIRVPRLRKSASFQPFHGMVNQRLAGMKGVVAGL